MKNLTTTQYKNKHKSRCISQKKAKILRLGPTLRGAYATAYTEYPQGRPWFSGACNPLDTKSLNMARWLLSKVSPHLIVCDWGLWVVAVATMMENFGGEHVGFYHRRSESTWLVLATVMGQKKEFLLQCLIWEDEYFVNFGFIIRVKGE